ncbi:hypothetical protein EVAR_100526_1 [Eumeta japonica]|uniref:Uncharacterized protein n=1 Tax=Eumeta variegata TaxID=151549 RepID=A0A4C2A5U3_EUMVA|nr:hypothetical protein EVAR_100526_1 [Eumeta japonica]
MRFGRLRLLIARPVSRDDGAGQTRAEKKTIKIKMAAATPPVARQLPFPSVILHCSKDMAISCRILRALYFGTCKQVSTNAYGRKTIRRSLRGVSDPFLLPGVEFQQLYRFTKDVVHYLIEEFLQINSWVAHHMYSQSSMMSSANTPSLKSVPFFVGEFHRARKPAPLNRFVHSQSSYDEQRQYEVSSLCRSSSKSSTVREISAAEPFYRPRRAMIAAPVRQVSSLCRSSSKSSTCAETSAAAPFLVTVSRAMISSARTPVSSLCRSSSKSSTCAETSAAEPFSRHGQSSDDKRPCRQVSSLCRSSSKSSTCAETSAAAPFSRSRSVER